MIVLKNGSLVVEDCSFVGVDKPGCSLMIWCTKFPCDFEVGGFYRFTRDPLPIDLVTTKVEVVNESGEDVVVTLGEPSKRNPMDFHSVYVLRPLLFMGKVQPMVVNLLVFHDGFCGAVHQEEVLEDDLMIAALELRFTLPIEGERGFTVDVGEYHKMLKKLNSFLIPCKTCSRPIEDLGDLITIGRAHSTHIKTHVGL